MNKQKRRFPWLLAAISFVQLLLIAGIVCLHKLANSSAGVNHHVVFRQQQACASWLSPDHRLLWQLLAVALLIAALLLLLVSIRRRCGRLCRLSSWLSAAFAAALLVELWQADVWLISSYALPATALLWLCEFTKALLCLGYATAKT